MRKHSKRLTFMIGLSALTAAAGLLPAGMASADVTPQLFVYTDGNFGGSLFGVDDGTSVSNLATFDPKFNDAISTVQNQTSRTYCFYKDANFSHFMFSVKAGLSVADLQPTGFNDLTSSFRPC